MLYKLFLETPPALTTSIKGGSIWTVSAGYIEPKFRRNSEWWAKPLPNIKWYDVEQRTDSILVTYWHDPKLRNRIAKEQNIKT